MSSPCPRISTIRYHLKSKRASIRLGEGHRVDESAYRYAYLSLDCPEPEKLSHRARIVCSAETLILSVASVWEISIKSHIGRLTLPGPPGDYLAKQIKYGGISVLPIQFRHAVAARELSSAHKDPFDRMLAAQCLKEHLPCVTKDRFFSECGVETIW